MQKFQAHFDTPGPTNLLHMALAVGLYLAISFGSQNKQLEYINFIPRS